MLEYFPAAFSCMKKRNRLQISIKSGDNQGILIRKAMVAGDLGIFKRNFYLVQSLSTSLISNLSSLYPTEVLDTQKRLF